MPHRWLAAAFALLLPCTASAADRLSPPEIVPQSVTASVWDQVVVDPPETRLEVGDRAPAFSYLAPDGHWHRFSDIASGPLLLVFGATDQELEEIADARSVFHDLGVTPVAVVDLRIGSAGALARRLNLPTSLITDPKRAIAALYNSLDPQSLAHSPSFFVLDEKRTIRALDHGPLPSAMEMLTVSAHSLGRALPRSAWLFMNG
jgi:peroxiredoxin